MKNFDRIEEIPNYQGILKMFFDVEKIDNKFGKKYLFFKTERKKILKGTLRKYNLDEEYEVAILKVIGKMNLEYFNPVVKGDVIKVIYCMGGECTFCSEPGEKKYSFKKGNILIYRMDNNIEKYKLESNELETITINLNLDRLKGNLSKMTDEDSLFMWTERIYKILDKQLFYYGKTNSRIDVISKYILKTSIKNISEYLMFKIKVFNLLISILELQMENLEKKVENHSEHEVTDKIKETLENYEILELPTVKELCEITGLTNHQIQTSFKKMEGMSLAQYIHKTKMDYAKFLIETTNKNIIDVAYETGYENPSKFSKKFREFFGILPSKYKKQQT